MHLLAIFVSIFSAHHYFNASRFRSANDTHTLIKGIIFDMDGTLTLPILDFKEMRRRAEIPTSADILIYVNSLEEEKKRRAYSVIEEMEDEANRNIQLQPGLVEVLSILAENKVQKALVTRNNRNSVNVFLDKLGTAVKASSSAHPSLLTNPVFSHILPRDFQPHKPHPAPVQHICAQWSFAPENVLMVGDDKTDILSGNSAGTNTVLFLSKFKEVPEDCPHDVIIHSLPELLDILKAPEPPLESVK